MLHIFGSTVKKRTVISLAVLYIVLLMIVIIAGKIKKMKLSSENISAPTTGSDEVTELSAQAVQTSTRRSDNNSESSDLDTQAVLQTLASATEAENNGLLTLVNMSHTLPSDWSVDLVQLRNGQSIDRRVHVHLHIIYLPYTTSISIRQQLYCLKKFEQLLRLMDDLGSTMF